MNILIIILVIIVILMAIVLIVAFFTSNEYSIEREIIINEPKQKVFSYLKYLKNQDHYNKWVMTDPDLKKSYLGTDGTVGFVYAWDSDNKQVGKGEQEIKRITEGESIEHEIQFVKPFEGVAITRMTTTSVTENQTRVKWIFSGLRNYPMKIMHLVLNLKKMLGKDLDKSLTNLKGVLEK